MQYAYLGASGLVVSKFGFGAMTFAAPGAVPFANLGRSDAETVVDRLIGSGVTLFDTANVYSGGQSETILGEILGERRREAIIVTKGGSRMGRSPNDAGLSARHLHLNVEASLKRLNTDWIDVYLCHLPDTRAPMRETLLALDQIVRTGKARYIGFSNWPAWLAAKAIAMQEANGLARFVAGQYQYSLLSRDIETEIVPNALDAGVGLMAYSPLASGALSGKYTDADPSGGGGRLSQMTLATGTDEATAKAVVAEVAAVAAERGVPSSAVALAWAAQQPAVSTVLMGVNRLEQLDANLKAAELELTADELERLGALSRPKVRYPLTLLNMLGDGWADPRDRLAAPVPAQRGMWAPKKA